MKSILALLVFVGVAWCNSTQYYGWVPNKELVYRFQSQVLTGIPSINDAQYAGLRLSAQVRVQAFSDYSLRVKFENPRFLTVNGEINLSEKGRIFKGSETENNVQTSEIPSHLRSYLEQPFLVHMKAGIVESFSVEASEPHSVSNIKRAFLSQIQMDISGTRRNEIESNHVQAQNGLEDIEQEIPLESTKDITYFTTREESLVGDCQTSYTIHKLPEYRSLELEQQWKEEEQKLYQQAETVSKGAEVCHGKQYFRITKTKNLDNCHQRPYFQKFVGIQSRCDSSKSSCADQMTHLVSSTCVVCGEPNEFVIRKCLKKDIVSQTPMGWNTEENLKSSATVTVELLKEESSFSPMPTPSNLKEKKSLIFEFPESNQNVSQGQLEKHTDLSGIRQFLPLPDLRSAPKLLFTTGISKHEITQQIVSELKRIAAEVFESPESCSANSDVAGYLAAISKYLLPLSYDELKTVQEEILSSSSRSEASQKVLKSLFFDVLSVVGTNPSTLLIKKSIESGELRGRSAINVLESVFRSIRTPTPELLKELVELTKSIRHLSWEDQSMIGASIRDLQTVSMVQMSKLLYRACIHPVRRMTEFPIRIYGHFCSNESRIITDEWIPYLESEIETSSSSSRSEEEEHFRLVAISSLGKLGHVQVLQPLVKVIDGTLSKRPMVRSVAVYSLKRVAKLNPVLVKPILLAIIDNPAENTQVRIAAVSVLPWSKPSTAQLQKIAVRTWFEPSKQVSSFIYSTLKTLTKTEVPELKSVGIKASAVIHMIKPQEYGVQFSHNANFGDFVNYLKMSVSKKVSWVFNEEEIVPTKISMSNMYYKPAFATRGISFSVYTQGMDYLLDKVLYYTKKHSSNSVSESVKEQLEKINEELKIQRPEEKNAEIFIQSRMAGYERLYTLNKDYIMEILEKASESLRSNPQLLTEARHFEYSRALQILDTQRVAPTAAGFLRYQESIMPVVYSMKGSFQGENTIDSAIPIPTKVTVKLMPIVNAKIHSHSGVICPFTEQFIGTGVDASLHLATPIEAQVEVENMEDVAITIKTPESLKKSFELVHVSITPYTAKKQLKTVEPISKSSHLKQILSKMPLKKIEVELGQKVGISSRMIAETDAKFVDLYSYWEKIKEHSLVSILPLGLLPSSVRRSSLKIVYNPNESETKEMRLHFSLSHGKRNHEDQEEEISHSDEKLIKRVCKNQQSLGSQQCQQQLKNLNTISREAEQVCQRHNFNNEVDRMRCHKTAEICEQAIRICESSNGIRSKHCQKKKEVCQKRVNNNYSLKQMLQDMGKGSQLNRLHVEASLKSRHSEKTVRTILSVGSTSEKEGQIVKYFASAEVEIPEKSAEYQVSYETKVVYPKISYRWNTNKLVEEEIKMEVDGKIKYGRKHDLHEITFQSKLEKSEEQKQSVLKSPEYQRCVEHEQQNRILSAVCMKVRHQAAAMDKIVLRVELPEHLAHQPTGYRIEELIKANYMSQLTVHHDSTVSSPRKFEVEFEVSRAGDVAQLKVERTNQKWIVKNIRLPRYLKNVLPLSLRNPLSYRLVQKITHNQTPASCRVESNYIGTFDNMTFHYELNNCKHLLFKDSSDRIPVAVLAKSMAGPESTKEVEILAGITKVVLKPKSTSQASGMEIELTVHSNKKSLELAQGEVYKHKESESGRIVFVVKRFVDNVYSIQFNKEMLQVITDGLRIEVIAPQLVRGRSCGLCGDLNGENTAEFKTPGQCIVRKNRNFAYSYMLNKEGQECSGIPQEHREEYNREIRECIKKEEIFTPLRNILKRLYTLANPTISVHLVKKQANQICISREKVKVCGQKQQHLINKVYLQGSLPVEVKPKTLDFTCFPLPSQKAFSLERRAKRGDDLQVELYKMAVHFTSVEYEPVLCQPQGQQQQQQQQQQLNNNLFPDF